MKILYKGKSPTYIGECECRTIIRAKKGEINFFMYAVRCPDCGENITVYESGSELAKEILNKINTASRPD